jgi:Flp pilus assembly pilin Flp
MTYLKVFKKFARDTSGAVTVDWVVLTAGICFFSVGIVAGIQRATTDQAEGIGAATFEIGSCALNDSYCE